MPKSIWTIAPAASAELLLIVKAFASASYHHEQLLRTRNELPEGLRKQARTLNECGIVSHKGTSPLEPCSAGESEQIVSHRLFTCMPNVRVTTTIRAQV